MLGCSSGSWDNVGISGGASVGNFTIVENRRANRFSPIVGTEVFRTDKSDQLTSIGKPKEEKPRNGKDTFVPK